MFTLYVDENRDSMLLLEAIDESFRMLKRGVLKEIRKPSMLDRLFKSNMGQLPCLVGEGDIIADPGVICEIIFVEPVQEEQPQPIEEPEYREYHDRFAERPIKKNNRQKKPRGVVEIPDEPSHKKVEDSDDMDDMFKREHEGTAQKIDNSRLQAILNMPLQSYEGSEYNDIESEIIGNMK